MPPSISIVVPLMKSAAPLHKNTHALEISAGSPARLSGTLRKYSAPSGSSLGSTRLRKLSVMVGPRARQFTRTRGPHSWASDRVMWFRPALAAPYDPPVGYRPGRLV